MDDLISRQAAIRLITGYNGVMDKSVAKRLLIQMPSAQRKTDEWCKDCSEYDHEKHCCPRFNRVIRTALDDAQPERIRGRWDYGRKRKFIDLSSADEQYRILGYPHRTYVNMRCSECRKITVGDASVRYDFCPHCGAEMGG